MSLLVRTGEMVHITASEDRRLVHITASGDRGDVLITASEDRRDGTYHC